MVIRHRNEGGGDSTVVNDTLGYSIDESRWQTPADPNFRRETIDEHDIYNITLNYDLDWAGLTAAVSRIETYNVFDRSTYLTLATVRRYDHRAFD